MDYLDHDIRATEGIKFEESEKGKLTYIVKYTQRDIKVGHFVTVGYDYIIRMYRMNKYASIGNIVLWMPITNGAFKDTNFSLSIIDKMGWTGKLIVYDVKCEATNKWIQTLYRYDNLLLCNVYDVKFSKNVFKIVWDKIGKRRSLDWVVNPKDNNTASGIVLG